MMAVLIALSVNELLTNAYIILEPIDCIGLSAYTVCAVLLGLNIIGGKNSERKNSERN